MATSMPQLAAIARRHAQAYGRFGARIAPADPPLPAAVYERYLFALLSRHCALERTVRAFQLLQGRGTDSEAAVNLLDAAALAAALREGRIGFHRTWPAQIAAFTRAYWDDPGRFLPADGEPFADARDRIAASVVGLGPAKTSFALGLVSPLEATICCIDLPIARMLAPLMGCSPAQVSRRYPEAEALLCEVAATAGLPLVLTHWIVWDHQRDGTGDCTRAPSCPLARPPGSESLRLIGPLFGGR